jgi:outer membrane protein OmpA-like peptidoglycan-associated protein
MSFLSTHSAKLASAAAFVLLAGCGQETRTVAPVVAYNPPSAAVAAMPESGGNWFHVAFASNSSQIDAAGRQAIGDAAQGMRNNTALRATVIGKADSVGSDTANMRLSRQRAYAVRDALIQTDNIQPARIETRWTGKRQQDQDPTTTVADGRGRVIDIGLH